jgi:hypothetical protein
MKTCTKCKEVKRPELFSRSGHRKDGRSAWCRACDAEKARARRKTPERYRDSTSKECPKCAVVKPFSEYFKAPAQKDGRYCYCKPCQRASAKNSYQKNRQAIADKALARKDRDPAFAKRSVSRGFWGAVGYDSQELAEHLEKQFLPGMNWGNRDTWHLDHITPIKSFSYRSFECPDFKACWGLANLRPIWAIDNLQKGSQQFFLL